jgi:hypothetical protein
MTGYDRPPPGTACVDCVWSTWCLLRQRATARMARRATDASRKLRRNQCSTASRLAVLLPERRLSVGRTSISDSHKVEKLLLRAGAGLTAGPRLLL